MKLYEFQSREILTQYGIPVPKGIVANTPDEAAAATDKLGGRSVVKAQVLTGGRGKAGGVHLASSPPDAQEKADKILGMSIKDIIVKKVLVVGLLDIAKEYYLSITLDRASKRAVIIASAEGGMDIEEVADKSPEKILKIPFNPEEGLDKNTLLNELKPVFGHETVCEAAFDLCVKMRTAFVESDCSLIEINPLAELKDGSLIAADAKIVIDDNSLIRHPDLEKYRNKEEYSDDETEAKKSGLSFIPMDGSIGCMVNGAGLAMATMDLVKLFGESPANFLDVGGSSNPQKVVDAFTILLRNPKIKAVLINIFGGITRCDDIARGILMAKEQTKMSLPLVVRIIGTNEDQAKDILSKAGIPVLTEMTEAVKKVIEIAKKEPQS